MKLYSSEKVVKFTQWIFFHTAIICTAGRSEEEFKKSGTGDNLAIQNGTTPESYILVPHDEDQVTKTTKFIAGQCFYGMGELGRHLHKS